MIEPTFRQERSDIKNLQFKAIVNCVFIGPIHDAN